MTRTGIVWCIPCLLALHNAEEAVMFPPYLISVRFKAPLLMQRFSGPVGRDALLVALLIVTVVPLMIGVWSGVRPQSKAALWSILLVQATVFLNVFAHLSSAVALFHGYGPGLLTALLINLPFSVYVFLKARKEKWLTRRETMLLIPAAVFLHGPGLIAAFMLAQVLS